MTPTPTAARTVEAVNDHPFESIETRTLERLVSDILENEGVLEARIGVILCGHDFHAELHRSYLGVDTQTDVLSFALGDNKGVIEGEVYVDLDTARERHAEFDQSFEDEVARYVIHGTLHLLGYDDKAEADRLGMHEKQEFYVSIWQSHHRSRM